jgi:hypothetical protein
MPPPTLTDAVSKTGTPRMVMRFSLRRRKQFTKGGVVDTGGME